MKKINIYLFLLGFTVLLFSCKEKIEEPEITLFEAVPSTINAGQEVVFRIQTSADYISLWGGSEGRNYDNYLNQINNPGDDEECNTRFNDKGIALTKMDTSVSYVFYTEPGTYKAVLIARNFDNLGEEYKEATKSISVEVLAAK